MRPARRNKSASTLNSRPSEEVTPIPLNRFRTFDVLEDCTLRVFRDPTAMDDTRLGLGDEDGEREDRGISG